MAEKVGHGQLGEWYEVEQSKYYLDRYYFCTCYLDNKARQTFAYQIDRRDRLLEGSDGMELSSDSPNASSYFQDG
jgi:hypothetical protein